MPAIATNPPEPEVPAATVKTPRPGHRPHVANTNAVQRELEALTLHIYPPEGGNYKARRERRERYPNPRGLCKFPELKEILREWRSRYTTEQAETEPPPQVLYEVTVAPTAPCSVLSFHPRGTLVLLVFTTEQTYCSEASSGSRVLSFKLT